MKNNNQGQIEQQHLNADPMSPKKPFIQLKSELDSKTTILPNESSTVDTQTTKRWRTRARQLEQVVAAQKIRINHLEEVIRSLKLQKNREIERIETFHKVKIDDLSRVQTDNLKKMKNVRDLHPAEKELISIPGNAA